MYSGRSHSSTQEQIIMPKHKGHLNHVRGTTDSLIDAELPLAVFEGIVAKKRKFGSDFNRNVGIVEDDPEKEIQELIIETPSTSRKVGCLRAFSNENSRFVNCVRKNGGDNHPVVKDQVRREKNGEASAQAADIFCSSVPSSSALPNCASPAIQSAESCGRVKKSESTDWVKQEPYDESWIRRKFYIVENGGKAAEVYCTDFIHRAKQGLLRPGLEENRALLRIADKWREEWNNGVQMPLGKANKESFPFERNNLFPNVSENDIFELPEKAISTYQTKYTRENSKNYYNVRRQPICYYTMDLTDEMWLEKSTSSQHPISSRTFVDIMNLLEISTYKRIHESLLEPLKPARSNSEDDAECIICRLPEWEPGDQIVFCDGCNISVHQSCYGIAAVPRGEWFCRLCQHFGRVTDQECIFCPVKGGAMKPTKHLDQWAHVVCALWISEVRFGDVEAREPITHVNEIPAEKWQARCCVCDTKHGACIKCIFPKCDVRFHVSCAQRANFVLSLENDEHEKNGVKMNSLCDKHSKKSPSIDKRSRFDKNRLTGMLKEFPKFVTRESIAKQLVGIPADVIDRVYEYWVFKRSTQNGNKPLIAEPEDDQSMLERQNNGETSPRKQWSRQKPNRTGPVPSIYDSIPHEQLISNYEGVRKLRLSYEKARNLCYMVTKREKIKKTRLELLQQQLHVTASNIFYPVCPISSRKMLKLLEEWKEAVESDEEEEDSTHHQQ